MRPQIQGIPEPDAVSWKQNRSIFPANSLRAGKFAPETGSRRLRPPPFFLSESSGLSWPRVRATPAGEQNEARTRQSYRCKTRVVCSSPVRAGEWIARTWLGLIAAMANTTGCAPLARFRQATFARATRRRGRDIPPCPTYPFDIPNGHRPRATRVGTTSGTVSTFARNRNARRINVTVRLSPAAPKPAGSDAVRRGPKSGADG